MWILFNIAQSATWPGGVQSNGVNTRHYNNHIRRIRCWGENFRDDKEFAQQYTTSGSSLLFFNLRAVYNYYKLFMVELSF